MILIHLLSKNNNNFIKNSNYVLLGRRAIIQDPEIGEGKKGGLAGVFVYKFKIHHQEMLLAYEWNPEQRLLLALGVHENFYQGLKRG